MPLWTPEPEWEGQEAIIIGGGPSLAGFDFSCLQGHRIIGCNDAFRLGPDIVDICIFGDESWWQKNKFELEQFSGRKVTCAPALMNLNCDELLQMNRLRDGIQHGCTLGWNYSTGAAAVNLAFSLGANTIYLLGFDMGRGDQGKTHWHSHTFRTIHDSSIARHIRGFHTLAQSLKRFPQVKVWNVTDGSSKLPVFDRLTFAQFLSRLVASGAACTAECTG